MRAVLEPVFGASGAVVAQFLLTLILVLIVVGAVVWLIRRYGGSAFGGMSRSRAPRLALVDTLAIDGRRKLVLVRRDSVEHLILVGGTTDVVVEPTIVRGISAGMRRMTQAAMRSGALQPSPFGSEGKPADGGAEPGAAEAPTPEIPRREDTPPEVTIRRIPAAANSDEVFPRAVVAEADEAEADDGPLPAILRRPDHVNGGAGRGDLSDIRPARIDSVFSLAGALDDIAGGNEGTESTPFEPARASPSPTPAKAPPQDDDPISEYLSLGEDDAVPAIAAPEIAERPASPPPTARVSDLEREMARLLGEITAKRGN
jgi:hypothetical protein